MSKRRQAYFVLVCLFWSVSASAQEATECIVPTEQVTGTSVGPDGIPPLTSPEVVEAAAGDGFMFADDLVLGIVLNGEARAYPHNVLWWHEMVNDFLGGSPVLVTFCPLTGSGLVFSPVINNLGLQNFGNSGLLFDNNNVMFDRTSKSLWVQMLGKSICGGFRGTDFKMLTCGSVHLGGLEGASPGHHRGHVQYRTRSKLSKKSLQFLQQ